MVTTALFSLATSHKLFHRLKDLVHASHLAIDKVLVVNLQKPMIAFVFLYQPMAPIEVDIVDVALSTSPPRGREGVQGTFVIW